MLFGKYIADGTIKLNKTLADLKINDIGGLMPIERTATVADLLGARWGVYHEASNPGLLSVRSIWTRSTDDDPTRTMIRRPADRSH